MSTKLTEYHGDTSLLEAWINGTDITPDYDDIFDVTFEVQYTVGEWRFEGYDTSIRFKHKNISGREIHRVCSLKDYELTDWLNSHTSFHVGSGNLAHSIEVIDRTLVKRNSKSPTHSSHHVPFSHAHQLPTGRGLLKMIIFGLLTFGIYPLVILTKISSEINEVARRHDGKSTMNYCLLAFIVGPITLGIGYFVWYHCISNRIGNELKRRNVNYGFSSSTFWGWCVLGSLLFGIGPWIYMYKFLKASNLMNANYNMRG